MFKNYLVIAFRNFWRKKVFSIINIAGLAIGISAALVIYLIVHYEFSFEKFQKDDDRIYRVVTNMHFPDQDFKNSGAPGPLSVAMRNDVAGIEESAVFRTSSPSKVTIGENNKSIFKKQKEIIYTDDHYFKLFPYTWIAGSPHSLLNDPNKVVLTESRAKVYFPFADLAQVIGQPITYNDTITATVTGIVKDLDEVTDFTFKEFISLATYSEALKKNNGWGEWGSVSSASQFFVKFQKGIDPNKINTSLADLRKKYAGKNDFLKTDHFLQSLRDIHFNPEFDAFDHRQGHKPTLYGLLAVAAFLLLLGCINFINLTTAQAAQRAKEIGIRKTMGSSKSHLIFQFLSETFFLTLIAAILSIALTPWILTLFSDYIPDGLKLDLFNQPNVILFILVLILVMTFLSGFYPALVLSGYKPVTVLKNVAFTNTAKSRRVWIRKTLTVSQFVIAQFFIISTLIVAKQIRYSLNKDLGFKKDAIINFRAPYNPFNPDTKQYVLLEKIKSIPGIQLVSLSGAPPASEGISISTFEFDNGNKKIETSAEVIMADSAYINLYKMKLLAGRNLQQSDTAKEYLINETYLKLLGYKNPADIIGKSFARGDGGGLPIVGVLADFHTKSTHTAIQPLILKCQAKGHTTFHVALNPKESNTDAWTSTIAAIGKEWKKIYPEEDFNYSFFDESIAKFYKKDQQTASLLNWISGLTIFISCLGLLGLVIYTTTQRTKEIGVRKVLGASVSQIVSLLSKDFVRLVIIAFVIAAPLAWWAMHKWLEDFAYRTTISWWIFALSGFAMIIIALLTLSIQTIRSAITNPVKSLRTE
jgi:putative ABC transport system permease protein